MRHSLDTRQVSSLVAQASVNLEFFLSKIPTPSIVFSERKVLWEIRMMVGKVVKLNINTTNGVRGRYGHAKEICPNMKTCSIAGDGTNMDGGGAKVDITVMLKMIN
ncbi:hypothetical protein GOBAR_AA28647 [Gossypium barbadense]|uniref:Uncharacterized protein n=1 Tax=Gossypium barbadense TaxID=3634 RepID=A0A2P5WLT5_GOSBA|nr:hypothetical protein GOBAR_AA28647 [Gossypium barbadense]